MIVPRLPWLALLCAAALCPDPRAQPPASLIERLQRAGEEQLPPLLQAYIVEAMRNRTFYPQQFRALRELRHPAAPWLRKWMRIPPADCPNPKSFRGYCMRALRDVLAPDAPEGLRAELGALADDNREPELVRAEAVYTLADFGDRKRLDEMIRDARKLTDSYDPRKRSHAHDRLAQIHYRLGAYGVAAKHLEEVLELHEAGDVTSPEGLQLIYYNLACFHGQAGNIDKAFAHLQSALGSGKAFSRAALEGDRDLRPLRADPRFDALLARYFEERKPEDGDGRKAKDKPKRTKKQDGAPAPGRGCCCATCRCR